MNVSKLVNWDPKRNAFVNYETKETADALASMTQKRHPAIEAFVDALTWMWAELKVNQSYCGPCFAGTGPHGRPQRVHGCCGFCSHLGETGCVAKPIGCAMYFCGVPSSAALGGKAYAATLFAQELMREIRGDIYQSTKIPSGHTVYSYGYKIELGWKLTSSDVQAFKAATRKVRVKTRQYQKEANLC